MLLLRVVAAAPYPLKREVVRIPKGHTIKQPQGFLRVLDLTLESPR